MTGIFNIQAWLAWILSMNTGWLFLLILPFVIAVIVVWSRSLKSDNSKDSQYD